jgi:hypothetical protein
LKLREIPLLVFDAIDMQVSEIAVNCIQVISKGSHSKVTLYTEFALVHQLDRWEIADLERLLLEDFVSEPLLIIRLQRRDIDVEALGGGSSEHHNLFLVDSSRALQVKIDEILIFHDQRQPSSLV